jgi:hypothetical protein
MAQDLLDMPLLGDFDCPLGEDGLFADLIANDFLGMMEQAELGAPAPAGSPTSSCSEHAAVVRCPSADVSSSRPCPAGQQASPQQQQLHTVTTAAPISAKASPSSSSPVGGFSIQWLAPLASAIAAGPSALAAPAAAHHSSPEPCGNTSDSSMDVQEARPNKRKAPEIDWRSIEDPEERRRQRRLAKNRITAARSRERKKVQLAGMEGKMQQLEAENAQLKSLLEHCMKENQGLREQLAGLASLSRGASPAGGVGGATEPAALILIATLLVLLHFLDAKGLSQALGLLLFTYVFFTATAAGQLSLKQLSSPFQRQQQQQQDSAAAAEAAAAGGGGRAKVKAEPEDDQAAERRWRQELQQHQQPRQPAQSPWLSSSVPLLCSSIKQEMPWRSQALLI